MEKEKLVSSVKYKCKQCDIEYDSRSELGRHIYEVHNAPFVKEKNHVIPSHFVEEFKYLGEGAYVRVVAEGWLTEKGMEVERFKYV